MKKILPNILNYLKTNLFLFFILAGPMVFAAPPDWETPVDMLYNMNITSVLQLEDGAISTNGNDMVAGFVGEEVRGVISPSTGSGDAGILYLTITSNEFSGELVTFKAYLADEDIIVDLDQTLVFEHLKQVGSIPDPFIFTFETEPELFSLSLLAIPADGGTPAGAGDYEAGETINITANASDNYIFTQWTGDTEHLDDPGLASAIVTMPEEDITLTANFIPQAPDVEDLTTTYDGTEHTVIASAPGSFTLRWYDAAEGGSITTIPTATNAGTYTAWAASVDGNDIESERVQATLTVNKATATIELSDLVQTYDGTEKSVTANTIPADLTVTITYDGLEDEPVNAGTYAVVAAVDDDNYEGGVEGELEITPATLTITAKDQSKVVGQEFIFDGTEFITDGLVDNGIDVVTSVSLTSEGAAAAAAVGTYAINPSNATGTGLDNYEISYEDGTMTVTEKIELTLEGLIVEDKTYDGNITATVNSFGALTGIEDGDDVSIDEAVLVAEFSDKNVGNDKVVNISNLVLTGDDAGKYFIQDFTVTASITPRELVLSNFTASNKTYDGTTTVSGASFADNRISGDILDFDSTAAFADPNAGTGKTVNFTDIEIIGGADQNNYILQSTTGTGQATINRASLQVIAEDKSKVYDGEEFSGFTVIYEGFVADEDESVLSGILIFGDEAEDAINAGTYTIQPGGLSSTNYNIGYTSATLTIEKAPLLVKADDKSKVYDGQMFDVFTVSYTGFVNGENVDVLGGELQFSGAAKDAINVGSYTIIASGLTAANYNIDYDEGTLVISPATLTVTADDKSKVYDKQVSADFTVQYTGFAEGEDQSVLLGSLQFSGDAVSEVNVGSYPIIPEGYTATNYSIEFVEGTLTITPASLTITADDKTKVYNAQAFTDFTVTYDGFAGSDSESELQGNLSIDGDAVSAVNVGTWDIIPGGYSSLNYNITYEPGNLEITPASLTVTADDKLKVYDAAIFADFTASYSGFAGSDGPGDLDGTLTFGGDAESAVNVGTYTIVPEGLLSENYNITFNSGTLNITEAALTITAEDKSKDYDGQAFTDFTVVYDGFVGGEDETSLDGSLSFDGTAVGALNAGIYEIIPLGYSSQNYDISYVNGELTITTVALTVTADDKSKPYDGQEFTDFTVSYSGFVTGEDEGDLQGTLSFAGTAVGAVNSGTYTIQPQGLDSGNYDIDYENGQLVITSVPLTITADDQNKVYDGNPFTAFTVSFDGFIDGDDESDLGGTPEFTGDAVGEINVGSYTIIPSGYTSQNYDIVYENGTLTITTRPLTITANDVNKTVGVELEFDGSEFTATGLVNNVIDQVTSVTLVSAGASADAEVGTYDIMPSNAQGVALENYSISYLEGTLTVTDKILLVISGLEADDKVYDGTTIATISDYGTLIGLQPGDDVSIDTEVAVANFNNKNVENNKLVTLSNIVLIGEDAVNYTINNQLTSASITPRSLTLFDFEAIDRPYDGTTGATGETFNDDRVSGDVLNFSFNAAFESPDAGTGKTVNFSDIQISGGADANNYQLLTFSGQATADINPVPLTITANDEQKVYDSQVFPGFSVAYSGFITGENEDLLTGTLSFSGEATTAVNAGEYEIVPEGLSSNNYIITFVAGTLTITPAELTITADNKSKVYDTQAFDAFTLSYSGFEGGDGPADLDGTLTFTGTAPDAVNAGEYSIIPQGLNSNNYTISFVNGILEITPALLTITADDKSKVYDGQVFSGFTVSYDGFAGNEDESVLQGNLNFSGTAFSAINAGVYQIIPQGVSSGNYDIEFLPGDLTITKAPLVITADDKSKTYNGQVFTAFTVSYSGFMNDENPGVLQGTLSYSGPAVNAINAGEYAIIPQGLTSNNYEIEFVEGLLTISKANLTITASSKTKVYDGQVFTSFTVLYSGFVSGENPNNLQGALSFSGPAVTATNVGTYEIIPQGLTSDNYNIAYVSGTLSITRASLSITADNKTKVYDGQVFTAFTVSYSGFVNGEGPADLQGTLAFSGSAVTAINTGAYIINAGGLSSGNYNISYSPGTLSITPAPLSITADDKSKVYDGGVFQGFTASYAGFVNGDGPSDLDGTLSFTGAAVNAVNVGSYIITPQGLSSPNYAISYVSGLLNITRATLTITADDQVKPVGVELVFNGTEFNAEGLVDNDFDEVESVTLFSNGAPASASVGDYPIIVSNAQGQGLSNYNISYVSGNLSVTDKIVLTLEGLTIENKLYDGTRTATVSDYGTLSGVEPGTDVQLDTSQATALFNNKNAGNNKTVTVSGLSLSGDDTVMYTIGSQTAQANITKRNLALSSFTANNKVYDGTTSVTGAAFDDDRIAGDVLNFSYNAAFEDENAGTAKQVLFTNIAISSGTDQNNYSLVTVSGTAIADISPKPIAISAGNKSKKIGEVDPELTWTITSGSLVGDDAISGELQREPGEDIGEYAIEQGTLTAGSNYQINFSQGIFTILPADLIVTIEPQAAVTAGAQWSIDGETWYNSGFALPLVPGDYTVEFSEIDPNAWYTPEPVSIEHASQTEISANYIPKYFLIMLAPEGNGSVTPPEGSYDYPVGENVTITASADEDWVFQHWEINGSVVGNNPYNFPITQNVTVKAFFTETIAEYLLTIDSSENGSVTINGDTYVQPMIFADGSQVILEAIPDDGFVFANWEGDLTGNENPATITMDDDKTISAVFQPETFTVTFIVMDEDEQPVTDAIITFDGTMYAAGQYTISDVLPGDYDYEVMKEGFITATGSATVSDDTEVTVILESSFWELEIVHEGTGITDPEPGIYQIEKNTIVNLSAESSPFSIFQKWVVNGEEYFDEEIEFLMDSDKTATAHFENIPSYELTISVEGEGTTNPEPGVYYYAFDEVVTLTAIATDDNWAFVKWVIDGIDYFENQINVLMNSDKNAKAVFVDDVSYTLDIDYEGMGMTNPSPGTYTYPGGTEITISAQPAQNYVFKRWEINGETFTNPVLTLIMNRDKVARAFFDLENTVGAFSSEYNIVLYPVPASDHIYLRFDQPADKVTGEIYDINGRMIERFEIQDIMSGNDINFNISNLEPGVYSMKITIRNEVVIKRFVVK